MAYGTVDHLVGQFKAAISMVVIDEGADAQDVMFALKKLTKEWVMPEETHLIPMQDTGYRPPSEDSDLPTLGERRLQGHGLT